MIIGLTIYSLVILVRNLVEGLRAVPGDVIDAATAMGYRQTRRLFAVELPIALPAIVAGLRLAAVSNISLVSVGALIGTGGLGQLFIHGFQIDNPIEIWTGIVATLGARGRHRPADRRRRPPADPLDPGGALGHGRDLGLAHGSEQWSGPDGIPARLIEHIWYSALGVSSPR